MLDNFTDTEDNLNTLRTHIRNIDQERDALRQELFQARTQLRRMTDLVDQFAGPVPDFVPMAPHEVQMFLYEMQQAVAKARAVLDDPEPQGQEAAA